MRNSWKIVLAFGAMMASAPSVSWACNEMPLLGVQDKAGLPKRSNCEATAVSQNDINACERDLYALSERALDDAVAQVFAGLEKGGLLPDEAAVARETFTKAQSAWCAARNANCDFDSKRLDGGSMAAGIAWSCRRERNLRRTEALETLARCFEGTQCGEPILLYMYELKVQQRKRASAPASDH